MRVIILITLLVLNSNAFTQSNSYYSSNVIKSLINPALLGNNDFDWNIENIYSSKRTIVDQNRYSMLLGGDYKIFFFPDRIVIGGFVSRSSYTGLPISEIELMGTISYQKKMSDQSYFVGMQVGVNHLQVDANQLVFPDQYNMLLGGFDNTIQTNEPIPIENRSYLDIALGIAHERKIYNFDSQFGFSLFHVNKPSVSISDSKSIKEIDFIAHASTIHHLNEEFLLSPEYYMFSNSYYVDNRLGVKFSVITNRFAIPVKSIWLASYFSVRNNQYPDLFLSQLGLQFYKFKAIINYDFSMGVTNNALQNYRVFELGLIFNGFDAFPKSYTIPCEIF